MSWLLPVRGKHRSPRLRRISGSGVACLSTWLAKADIEDGNRPGITESEAAQVRELKKRNRLLEQENEVLRRAAAYLSQANLPGK